MGIAYDLFDWDMEEIDREAHEDEGDGVGDLPAAGEEGDGRDGEQEEQYKLDDSRGGHCFRLAPSLIVGGLSPDGEGHAGGVEEN